MRRDIANRTDPSRNAEMLVATSDGPIKFEDKSFSAGGSGDSFVSTDPAAVRDFLKGNCLTGGFSVQFAVNNATREVVELFKKGRVSMRDVKPLIAKGFDEWTFSWAWAPSFFRFSDGSIVAVSEKIDLSPRATTREAFRWRHALGRG